MNYVNYKNREYVVFPVAYKGYDLPVVVERDDIKSLKNLDKNWHCNQLGIISCTHNVGNRTKEIYLHDIIMSLHQDTQAKPIVHINKIGLDNRIENLIYDVPDKYTNKNLKKKKRTITLPKNCGIRVDDIPTYIWYMRADQSHGDRFIVNIGDFSIKTTSSIDLSLKYKLEEAKMYLRYILRSYPDLFEEFSMNGDYNKDGKELLQSYHDIINLAGYNYIQKPSINKNTLELLKPGKLHPYEAGILAEKREEIKEMFDYN